MLQLRARKFLLELFDFVINILQLHNFIERLSLVQRFMLILKNFNILDVLVNF
jgi:hypothetical protein